MLNISENAMKVLQKRYLGKDENGRVVEDVEAMFRRVARAVAGAGAVVTKDVPPDTLVVGVPARAIRKLEPRKK